MADNVVPTVVTNPGAFAFRTEDRGTATGARVQTPVTLLDVGGVNGEKLVGPQTPLPVQLAENNEENPVASRIVGNPDGDFAGLDLLEQVIDPTSKIQLQVAVANPPKQDAQGAQIPSDCAVPFIFNWSGTGSAPLILDTTGYQMAVLQNTTTQVISITTSNDGITYFTTECIATSNSVIAGNQTSSTGVFLIPITGRYLKFTAAIAVTSAVIYLRQTPYNPFAAMQTPTVNVTQLGGNAISQSSAGGMTVTGTTAVGFQATSTNPIVVAGTDVTTSTVGGVTNLIRNMRVDTQGRPQAANIVIDGAAVQRQAGSVFSPTENVVAATVRDTSRSEDSFTIVEMLYQLLIEQKITNQYLFNLASNINGGLAESDEPASYRGDPTVFQLN